MTTSPVMTVTDELLEELESRVTSWKCKDHMAIKTLDAAMLIAEFHRLRAENAELAKSLAESRANDQAAMGWLTSLRWASGDRGERMLPELVTHIELMAKDAGRYRWLRDLPEGSEFEQIGNFPGCWWDESIDTAMAIK